MLTFTNTNLKKKIENKKVVVYVCAVNACIYEYKLEKNAQIRRRL